MKYTYYLTEIKSQGGENLVLYGITVMSETGEKDTVEDISCDAEFVERLIDKFNAHQLSPIHMREVIYDEIP